MDKSNQQSPVLAETINDTLLHKRLRVHRRQSKRLTPFNLLILIDLAFVALLFSILFTRFVTLPGMDINLVRTGSTIVMPHKEVVVLTLENKDTIFFDGGIFNLNTIKFALERYLESKNSSKQSPSNITLIIRSDSNLPLESFLDLCSMADDAGYSRIQILGQTESN